MKTIFHRLCLVVPLGCLFFANIAFEQTPSDGKFTMIRIRRGPAVDPSDMKITASDIAALGVNHVVNISAVRLVKRSPLFDNPQLRRFYGPDYDAPSQPDQTENSLGSGVFISEDGYVVTNNHVVENAGVIKVTWTGRREFEAEIVGTDPGTDLAVIRLKGDFSELTPVQFGNSDSVRVGDIVMAIGNPYSLNRSVSMGIVSGLGRANFGIVDYENFIQTDAAINPGNSGGALINMRGELVGINTAILSGSGGSVGVGFAVPANMVLEVVEQILKTGRVIRGSMGVMIQSLDQDLIDAFKLPGENGVIITDVVEGGAAKRAGLKRADVITRINDTDIGSLSQFRNIIAFSKPGDALRITLLRGGKEMNVRATLTELKLPKKEPERGAAWKPKPGGLTVTALSPDIRQQMRIPAEIQGNVVVARVEPGSAAEIAGFDPGDIILEVNHTRISSMDQFTQIYRESKKEVVFLVQHQGSAFFRYLRNK